MKLKLLLFVLLYSAFAFSQIANGPAYGVVLSGQPVGISMFPDYIPSGVIIPKEPRNKIKPTLLPDPPNLPKPLAPAGSNYHEDPKLKNKNLESSSFVFSGFTGIPQTNSIPPDPYLAVGPNHVIITVNSSFRICTKDGRTLKTVAADEWFNNVFQVAESFDPKVIYDHFSNRWVMVWLQQDDVTKTSSFLISASQSDNPLGGWYNYVFPSNVNGSASITSWADYQGVGFDEKSIYLTSNQFGFTGGYHYTKIRVINKSQLYANTGGPVSFYDFWNIRAPEFSYNTFTLRPARMYSPSDVYYLVARSRFSTGTFISLYKITYNDTIPVLTGVNIPITQYTDASTAGQLNGGGGLPIETSGSNLTNEPIYKDGRLHLVHSIASGSSNQFSAVRYLCLNTIDNTTVQDIAMGADGYWHFYPAVAIDKDDNVIVTYSRSGVSEYIGAYYTVKLNNSNTFSGSEVLQTGKSTYVKDFSSGRNRWGDYMGAWSDMSDRDNFWVYTEFVSAKDTWDTYVAGIRIKPFSNPYITIDDNPKDFGNIEINKSSTTKSILIKNYGEVPLIIDNISNSNPNFIISVNSGIPSYINPFDSLEINFSFAPQDTGYMFDSVHITSNAFNKNNIYIKLTGKGYKINPVKNNLIYASARAGSLYNLVQIEKATGFGTAIGLMGSTNIPSMSILNNKKELYGLYFGNMLIRINASMGDFYNATTLPMAFKSISFDKNDQLYGITTDDILYKINFETGDTTFLFKMKINVGAIAFNPISNELYTALSSSNLIKDKIYKIDMTTGDTIYIGRTGFNMTTNGLAFDADNELYGVRGTILQNNILFKIDKSTGLGSDIGSTGFKGVGSLAIFPIPQPSSVEDDILPSKYLLSQNYPNPFNPTTTIQYEIPTSPSIPLLTGEGRRERSVTLKIYDILGREIETLVNEPQVAGKYSVEWNASKYSSGVYYYELNVGEFKSTKKMMLVK